MPQKPLPYLQVSKKSLIENRFSKDTADRTTFGGIGECHKANRLGTIFLLKSTRS
jgi:hypothetical protein